MPRQLFAPNDSRIVGTFEVIHATAQVKYWNDDGTPEHSGFTDVDWDSTRTQTDAGNDEIIVVAEDGELYSLGQCTFRMVED